MVMVMWTVAAYQVGWFSLRVGGHLALSLHSANEPGELSQWLAMMTAPQTSPWLIHTCR